MSTLTVAEVIKKTKDTYVPEHRNPNLSSLRRSD